MASILRLSGAAMILSNTALGLHLNASRRAVTPVVASTTNYRLWTCRDTQLISSSGQVGSGVLANTATFSGMPSDKSNPQRLFGLCSDNSRWVGWPDTGPVVTFRGSSGQVNAYAFIAKLHLSGLSVLSTPSFSLYHVISQTAGPLPATSVVYLYGGTSGGKLAVAGAARTGFLGSLEDHSLYEYYVNGAWTRTIPASNNAGIVLPNTSSVQGTIYFSPKWQSFVWTGGDGFPNANFFISTAPNPEGPWTVAKLFYSGAVGTGALPAYSTPSLTDGTGNYIFISWTRIIPNAQKQDVYDQPLVRVDWQ
ncbi:hypothetical protein C8J57DRAFT_1438884 [Mycena rebaudengoi]|nr:hypothetical protein C8J57DRAFT_1438884 [Mycena rebaudengoi]